MLTYPPLVPAAVRARIALVLTQVDDAFQAAKMQSVMPDGDGGFVYRAADASHWDTAAVEGLLRVADVILETLSAVALRDHWSAADLARVVPDLIEQRVVWTYVHQHSQTVGLPVFADDMQQGIHGLASWQQFQTTLSELGAEKRRARSRPPRDVSRLSAERERVVMPLLDELNWTPTRWATKAGVNPHVTIGYLKGTSTPRKPFRVRITYVLATALKQPTLQLPE